MDKLIIDIDNTLWDLAPVLYGRLREVNPKVPPPDQWHKWGFWRPYLISKEFYKAIDQIHLEQERFLPYSDAAWFLNSLKEQGFYIVVASHRRKEALPPTARWLHKNGLFHDEIHISYDKTVLFGSCWGVVDDSPVTLTIAKNTGIVRTGLKNPWNAGEDHPLFSNLAGVAHYLAGQERAIVQGLS
jgi:hypothetical protein